MRTGGGYEIVEVFLTTSIEYVVHVFITTLYGCLPYILRRCSLIGNTP